MKPTPLLPRLRTQPQPILLAFLAALALASSACLGRVLDDFNDNTKTAWSDFTFVPGVGLPTEQGGQFTFSIPGAVIAGAQSSLFSASTKTSETFSLQEGRTVEFRADIVQAGGGNSFAILGFVPASAGGPGQLKGYSLAKSTTEIIIAKGINQYFIDDDTPTAAIKNEDITLVLSMTVKNGSVILIARVLDKAAGNAVLWERTVVDTPGADVMDSGTDSPATPWLESGNLALYLYANYDSGSLEDPYQATYDNLEVLVTDTTVLDDFNDNTKSDWTDFTFVPGVGLPVEQSGQFAFGIPGAVLQGAGSGLFSASSKTSRTFDLVEGERVVFSVDILQGGAKDSFAVLSFIPTSSGGPGQLKGYSLAKSTTDVLIVKGINQYFVADNGPTADLKQENVTLVLSLTVRGGSVILEAEVRDKDANDAVIWDRTIVDTPQADVMADGSDNPAAPFLGSGNFVLYLYADYDASAVEDPYQVTYDNAVVSAPPLAANLAPIISETQPADFANFLPASTQISFKVTDDKALSDGQLSVRLNGVLYTTNNGLVLAGSGTTRTATLGDLAANLDYTAVLQAEDSEGLTAEKTVYFDTFLASNLAIEIEDYNFGSGQFIDNPVPVSEGLFDARAYSLQIGTVEVDFSDTRTAPSGTDTLYRPDDPVRMGHTRDSVRAKYTAAGGTSAGVFDYDVADIAAGEWLNYTRTFPAGSYEVYLRQALANMATGESVLEQVTSDASQTGQTTRVLGSFLGSLTGFQYRNFALTDGTGLNKVTLRLSGRTTFRLRQVTPDPGDGLRLQNYLMFVPVEDPGVQRATVSSVSPAPDSIAQTVALSIQVTIQNRDTSVNTSTVKLELNGAQVPATVTPTATGADVSYAVTPLPASGATNHAVVSFRDNLDADVTTAWDFVVSYRALDPALRVLGTGRDAGLNVRVVQQEQGVNTDNSLAWAESLLAPTTTLTKLFDTNLVAATINFSQNEPVSADGYFPDDVQLPGIAETFATDDIAMEVTAYLELAAGQYRFGARCDDGYKVQVVADFNDRAASPLAFHNGGPADETYDFVVTQGGLYRFRMVWYERGGSAHVEWFSTDFAATPARLLVGDPAAPAAIKAFRSVAAPAIVLESSTTLASGSFAPETGAVVDANARTVTVARSGNVRFYRLSSGAALRITGLQFQGANVVLGYE